MKARSRDRQPTAAIQKDPDNLNLGRSTSSRNVLTTLTRVVISGGLLALVFLLIDIRTALSLVAQADYSVLAFALIAFLCVRIVTAMRWFLLLRAYGIRIPYLSVLRITFISTAIGQFLPGGADAASIYQVFREDRRLPEISVAVILDRIVGVGSMLILSTSAIFIAVEDGQIRILAAVLTFLFVILIAVIAGVVTWGIGERILGIFPSLRKFRIVRGTLRIIELLTRVPYLRAVLWRSTIASVVVQLFRISAFALIFASLGQNLHLVFFVAFIPLVFVILSLPLTIAGFGVRESSLAFLFSTVGVPAEVSVSAGLLAPLLVFLSVVPGVVLFSVWRPRSVELHALEQGDSAE